MRSKRIIFETSQVSIAPDNNFTSFGPDHVVMGINNIDIKETTLVPIYTRYCQCSATLEGLCSECREHNNKHG